MPSSGLKSRANELLNEIVPSERVSLFGTRPGAPGQLRETDVQVYLHVVVQDGLPTVGGSLEAGQRTSIDRRTVGEVNH